MRRQSQFYQDKINLEETVFVSAIYDYDDHIASFNDGDLAFAVDDMIEVTDTTFDDDGGWWAGINLRTKSTGLFPSNYVAAVSQEQVNLFLNKLQDRRSFVYEEYTDTNTGRKSYRTRKSNYNDIPSFNPLLYDDQNQYIGGEQGQQQDGPRRPTAYDPNKGSNNEQQQDGPRRPTAYNPNKGGSEPRRPTAYNPNKSSGPPKPPKPPPPKGGKGKPKSGGGGGGGKDAKKGGGGGGGKGGKRSTAGANSRSRFGIYSTNVTIYSSIIMSSLGFALILSSGNDRSPWLHECWEHVEMQKSPNPKVSPLSTEFGCNRIHTTYDMIIGFYAFVFGVIVGIMENFTGWERTGKPGDFKRSILYMVLVLPCFTTMTTLIPSIFIYLACGINYFATFHKKEIFTNNPKRPKRVRLCPPTSLCECSLKPASREMSDNERLCQCLSGKINPEARFGRIFSLGLYIFLNLFFGLERVTNFNEKIASGKSQLTYWVPWAKFFGAMMDINFTLIFLPVSRVTTLGKMYRSATINRSNSAKRCSYILEYFPLDYALEFHMLCGYVGYVSCVMHVFCHVMNYNARAQLVWETYGIGIWLTGITSLLILTLLTAATHNNVRRNYFAIFWMSHLLGFFGVTVMNLMHTKYFYDTFTFANAMSEGERAWTAISVYLILAASIVGGFVLLWRRSKYFDKNAMNITVVFYSCLMIFWSLGIYNLYMSGFGAVGSRYSCFFLVCMPFYTWERWLHFDQWKTPVTLYNFTVMGDKVLTLSLGKEAFSDYKEGEYAYIYCPHVSWLWKHPFTICSAPFESTIQFSIRVGGKHSWTRKVRDYLQKFNIKGESYCELISNTADGVTRGKLLGPDGKPFFMLYGPCAAPTRHIGEYEEVMICASGIGVTPLASSMKSIVFDKWPKSRGKCYPARAHFFWVCSHRDVDAFRWFIRTIKEADDQVTNYIRTANDDLKQNSKMFHVHIFVTSVKTKAGTNAANLPDPDNDTAFWGRRQANDMLKETNNYQSIEREVEDSYTEWDLYSAINNPSQEGESFGEEGAWRVHVHFGRPKWDTYFDEIRLNSPFPEVGVTFCGNPLIGNALEESCAKHTSLSRGAIKFALHSEVF